MKIKNLCLPVLLIAPVLLAAQEKDPSTIKVKIFRPGEDSLTPPPAMDNYRDKNLISWNYSVLSRGVFLVNYDFFMGGKMTGEIGAGVTYRDFVFELLKYNQFFDEYANADFHLCGEAGFRFYPGGFSNFDGIYLSPVLSYRKYTLRDGGGTVSASFTPGYEFLDVQLKMGFQYESWYWDVLGDFYVGIAMRNATVRYTEVQYNSSSSNPYYDQIIKDEAFPQILLGFKISFPL